MKPPFEKPIVAWVIGGDELARKSTAILEDIGVQVFASPERAVRAIHALSMFHNQTENL